MLVSRGQIFAVGLIESAAVIGIGTPLGIAAGSRLARLMGYTQSSMSFVWREPLPVSPLSFNVPMVATAVVSTLIARLGPIGRSARTSVVEHERVRARPPGKPFWQRFYLDVALLTVEVLSIRADFGAASLGEMMNRLAQQDDGVIVSEKAAALFIPFFQAADGNVLNPPALLPRIAWAGIGQIAAAFTVALVIAQGVVIATALRGGVFQALGWEIERRPPAWPQDRLPTRAVGHETHLPASRLGCIMVHRKVASTRGVTNAQRCQCQSPGCARSL